MFSSFETLQLFHTTESISSKYGTLDGELLVIDLSRNQLNQPSSGARNTNLGLSLAGNKDRSSYKSKYTMYIIH